MKTFRFKNLKIKRFNIKSPSGSKFLVCHIYFGDKFFDEMFLDYGQKFSSYIREIINYHGIDIFINNQ